MPKLEKNDKVKILSENSFWNDKVGTIISDIDEDNLDNISVKIFLDENNDKYIIETFSLNELELENKNENLIESLNKKDEVDYIKNYVYAETLDGVIPHWFFADKIATTEDKNVNEVVKFAKTHKYKIFKIKNLNFNKLIIAAPKCSLETIKNEYADYLLGNDTIVTEVK